MVRKIDELGRIVIPAEIRQNLDLQIKDTVEIFTDENRIILQKYQPSCLFCNNVDNVVYFNDKRVCRVCLEKLKNLWIILCTGTSEYDKAPRVPHFYAAPAGLSTTADQLQQQEISRMAMIMSQIQLLSNRLQKQLFIVVSPYQNLRGGYAIPCRPPLCYHIMRKYREGDRKMSKCSENILRLVSVRRKSPKILSNNLFCNPITVIFYAP